ncbi:AEC family transporter [Alkalihalobacillus sp. TS-13]|uniref:AEC family transporter n=1 Tax=Alkalihalobacillus sp. TS-13 TaxID=2842455 RepID=UPI001C876435|nr:AEC family transporter [Alkalihalobacillus sp. TS-13]
MFLFDLLNIVFPIFFIILIGFIVGKYLGVNPKPVSDLCIYVFSPALFFYSVTTSSLDFSDLGKIAMFGAILFVLFAGLMNIISFFFKWAPSYKNAMMLASAFPNAGNYGLPIIMFAFGETGVTIGIIFAVIQSLLMNSAGIYYASRNEETGFGQAFSNIFKMPAFVAIILAIFLKLSGIQVPVALANPVELLGNAAIPALLTLLGINLSNINVKSAMSFISIATTFKLIVYPAIAYLIIGFFYPLDSLWAKVLILSSATPTAATTTLLATKFELKSEYVSSAMFVSTVTSLATISFLLFMI